MNNIDKVKSICSDLRVLMELQSSPGIRLPDRITYEQVERELEGQLAALVIPDGYIPSGLISSEPINFQPGPPEVDPHGTGKPVYGWYKCTACKNTFRYDDDFIPYHEGFRAETHGQSRVAIYKPDLPALHCPMCGCVKLETPAQTLDLEKRLKFPPTEQTCTTCADGQKKFHSSALCRYCVTADGKGGIRYAHWHL